MMVKHNCNNSISFEDCKRIHLELDPALLPETVAFFESRLNEELSAYELAAALVACDRTVDMPRVLFDFIVDLYKKAMQSFFNQRLNKLKSYLNLNTIWKHSILLWITWMPLLNLTMPKRKIRAGRGAQSMTAACRNCTKRVFRSMRLQSQ